MAQFKATQVAQKNAAGGTSLSDLVAPKRRRFHYTYKRKDMTYEKIKYDRIYYITYTNAHVR